MVSILCLCHSSCPEEPGEFEAFAKALGKGTKGVPRHSLQLQFSLLLPQSTEAQRKGSMLLRTMTVPLLQTWAGDAYVCRDPRGVMGGVHLRVGITAQSYDSRKTVTPHIFGKKR